MTDNLIDVLFTICYDALDMACSEFVPESGKAKYMSVYVYFMAILDQLFERK